MPVLASTLQPLSRTADVCAVSSSGIWLISLAENDVCPADDVAQAHGGRSLLVIAFKLQCHLSLTISSGELSGISDLIQHVTNILSMQCGVTAIDAPWIAVLPRNFAPLIPQCIAKGAH